MVKFAKGEDKLRLWVQNGFTPNHDNMVVRKSSAGDSTKRMFNTTIWNTNKQKSKDTQKVNKYTKSKQMAHKLTLCDSLDYQISYIQYHAT